MEKKVIIGSVLVIAAAVIGSVAVAQPYPQQGVTVVTDPIGQVIANITNNGSQSIVTDNMGQVTAVITNPQPQYTPAPQPPMNISPLGYDISMPKPPALPQVNPWGKQ